MSGDAHMFDGTVWQLQSMLEIRPGAITGRPIDMLLHETAIVGVHSRHDKFQRRFRSWIALKDSECLDGPEDLATGNLPSKASCVTQCLGFGQVCFASPNCLLRNLTFRDVYDRSHNFFVACFFP